MGKNVDEEKAGRDLHPRAHLQSRDVARRNTTKKAGPGEPLFGKIPKMSEVLRRGYKRRVSREWLGGILINVNFCNVI